MSDGKSRHGCLTVWLVIIIAASALAAVVSLGSTFEEAEPDAQGWLWPVYAVVCLFNVVCGVALFRWKKWGFWGFLLSGVVGLIVNLAAGIGPRVSFGGLVGVAVLYGVLQIGNENKGWPQLE